jgi:hypothetical protein
MAQSGYTPIQIYSSSTGGNTPSAANLTNSALGSELAINITDGKLFYKDNSGSVQVIGWKVVPTTAGGTGLTTYTAGDTLYYASGTTLSKLGIGAAKTIMTSSGTAPQWSASLDTTQGGTGLTTYTAGDLPYFASGTALSKLGIGAANTVLTSSGSAPQWTAQSSLSVGTALNLLSNATTGVMQIVGPSAATTRVMTIPDANFTVARTDASQNFNGTQFFNSPDTTKQITILAGNSTNQILGDYASGSNIPLQIGLYGIPAMLRFETTGDITVKNNLIQGTAAKGINFTANTAAAGMTSQLLNWYETGTWTPSVGGSATYYAQVGKYTRIGNIVRISGTVVVNVLGTGSATTISGLPYASTGSPSDFIGFSSFSSLATNVVYIAGSANGSSQIDIRSMTAAGNGLSSNNVIGNGTRLDFAGTYSV